MIIRTKLLSWLYSTCDESWKDLQAVFLYDKTEMLKHLWIPSSQLHMSHAQPTPKTEHVELLWPPQNSALLHSLPPSLYPFPAINSHTRLQWMQPAQAAHCTAVPGSCCVQEVKNIICWQAWTSSSQLHSYGKRRKYLMFIGQLSHLLFFQQQPETDTNTFPRTNLNIGRGQNEAACFNFLSAYLTAPA